MDKAGQRKGWFNTAGKSVMRRQCAVSPFCPAIAEGEPSGSCWMGTFFSYSVKNSKECAKGMCEEREEEEICPFPQIFCSLDIFSSHFLPCFFLMPLPVAWSPFISSFQISQSLPDFHHLSAAFEFSLLLARTVPPHLLLRVLFFSSLTILPQSSDHL